MAWASALQSLINQVIKRSEHLQDRLEELESKRFTSSQAPIFLIHLLSASNKKISQLLVEFSRDNLTGPIDYERYQDLLDEVKMYASLLGQLYRYIYYIEACSVESSPPGIVSAIDRVARTLFPKVPVLICPSFQCVYEYHNLLSKTNLGSERFVPHILDESIVKDRKHFPLLIYPLVLRKDILCQTLLMHELGHFFVEVDGNFDLILRKNCKKIPKGVTSEDLKDFYAEYLADNVAVCILGESFLFALIEFHTSIAGPANPLPRHPPLLLRIRNILDTIEIYGQRFREFITHSALAKEAEDFLNTLDKFTQLDSIPVDRRSKNIFQCIKSSLSLARDKISENIPAPLKFHPSKTLFNTYINWVEQGIPPAARKEKNKVKPLGLGELLNAVWLYQLVYLQTSVQLPSTLRESEYTGKLHDLSRLAQLAIRQNEVVRLYKEARI